MRMIAFRYSRQTGFNVDIAGHTGLDQICDSIAIAVDQSIGEIFLDGGPKIRITILRKLAQSHPDLLARAAQLVESQDLVLCFIHFRRYLPALDLEDNPEDFDPILLALFDKLTVIDEAIESKARIDRCEGFLFQVGQRDRTSAHGCPDEGSRAVVDQMVDH